MKFEYDQKKSKTNKEKHGIDFFESQLLWEDPDIIEIPAKLINEPRYLVIGMLNNKHWSGIITYRNENIRIISIRRSRIEEVKIYES